MDDVRRRQRITAMRHGIMIGVERAFGLHWRHLGERDLILRMAAVLPDEEILTFRNVGRKQLALFRELYGYGHGTDRGEEGVSG
jgi:hypothetical protein